MTEGCLLKIVENVYIFSTLDYSPARSYGANVGIIVGNEGILIIDTLISSKGARELIENIRKISDKPIKWAINTHHHSDHSFGNAEFKKLGAAIISQEKCLERMKDYSTKRLQDFLKDETIANAFEGTEIVYPTVTFSEKMTINVDDIKVELYNSGHTHTLGSSFVYLPAQKIMFTGDIVFTDSHANLIEGDLEGWYKALDYMNSFDVDKVVPGHGPIASKESMAQMKQYLITFDDNAKRLCSSYNKEQDINVLIKELEKTLPSCKNFDVLIGWNLKARYIK